MVSYFSVLIFWDKYSHIPNNILICLTLIAKLTEFGCYASTKSNLRIIQGTVILDCSEMLTINI